LSGDRPAALEAFERLVAAGPIDVEAHYWLASARLAMGDAAGGEHALDTARVLHSVGLAQGMGADITRCRSEAAYANQVADELYAANLVAMSSVVRSLALAIRSDDVNPLLSYGLSLQHQGRPEAAIAVFQWAAAQFPFPRISQFAVYLQLFCEDGERRHAQAARGWANQYIKPGPTPTPSPAPDGRLRIGYVAPSFAKSQLQQFIAPVLDNHDPAKVRVVLYPQHAVSEVGWPSWIEVHPIGDRSDDDAAALVRRDGIDVLNDCWGHTAGSRLGSTSSRRLGSTRSTMCCTPGPTGRPRGSSCSPSRCGR
jgi:hypothetical protein